MTLTDKRQSVQIQASFIRQNYRFLQLVLNSTACISEMHGQFDGEMAPWLSVIRYRQYWIMFSHCSANIIHRDLGTMAHCVSVGIVEA